MKYKFYRAMSAASIVMFASAVSAQQATAGFAEIDTDGSGDISYEESEAVFGSRGTEGLFRNDANGDGVLTVDELTDGGSAVDSEGNVVDSDGNVVEDAAVEYEDIDRGHGNDPDGFDEDNPGQGHDKENGEVGGGNGNSSNSGGNGKSGGKGNNG